jgi:hypothetical protein
MVFDIVELPIRIGESAMPLLRIIMTLAIAIAGISASAIAQERGPDGRARAILD